MKLQRWCDERRQSPTPVCSALALTIENPTRSIAFERCHSGPDSISDADDDYRSTSSVTTPLTPLSPQELPRHPSDVFKIHCCTYKDCGKSFNRPAKLAQHLRSHTNTRPFQCPHALCTKDFLRESHLKHHVKSAHLDVRAYVCEWEDCRKGFVTATRLKRHHATHKSREKFRCTIAGCGQLFRKHGTLRNHIVVVHEGRKPYICKVPDLDGIECGAGFDNKGQLKAHTGKAHEVNTFICTICPPECRRTIVNSGLDQKHVSFPTSTALQWHIQCDHPPTCTKRYDCHSPLDFKSHSGALDRILDINDSKAYACCEHVCGQGFTNDGVPSLHVGTSRSLTPFICNRTDISTPSQVANWDAINSSGKAFTTTLEEDTRVAHQGSVRSHKVQTQSGTFDESTRKYDACVLTRLTGAGYEEESGRDISCLIVGCSHRFLREYDREIHLQSRHGLPGIGFQEMRMSQGEFHSRQTLQGLPNSVTKQDVNIERVLDIECDDHGGGIGEGAFRGAEASRGDDFWLGGGPHQDKFTSDEWVRDEQEMRYLIDNGL